MISQEEIEKGEKTSLNLENKFTPKKREEETLSQKNLSFQWEKDIS
jgi:hypothetical protein